MTQPRVIDVAAVVDASPIGAFQKRLVATCFVLMMLDSVDLSTIGFASPAIAAEWGVNVSSFGPIFGAGMLGIMIGSLTFGLAADYWGRRLTVITGVAIFGLLTLLTVTATSFQSLLIYRFFTGLGLGAVIPNVIAITSEYSPASKRALLISGMSCGLPLGGLFIGLLAVPMIPALGWRSVFYVGGLLPLALVPVLIWRFPESVRFLALKKTDRSQLVMILRKIAPEASIAESDDFVIGEAKLQGSPVRHLFSERHLRNTILLWTAFFSSLLMLFTFNNWLPALLQAAGIPLQDALFTSTFFFLGGATGGILLAGLSARFPPHRVVGWAFIGAAVFAVALGMISGSRIGLMVVVFLFGLCVIGTQININVIAAAIYPTAMRSTGIGWALGVGRIGSIVGPVGSGVLLSRGTSVSALFFLTAIPGLLAAASVFQVRPEYKARTAGQ